LTDGQVLYYYSDANLLLLRLKSITLPTQKETKELPLVFRVVTREQNNKCHTGQPNPPQPDVPLCLVDPRAGYTNKTPRVDHSNQLADISKYPTKQTTISIPYPINSADINTIRTNKFRVLSRDENR
jgi:hypothetical protein